MIAPANHPLAEKQSDSIYPLTRELERFIKI